MSVKFNIKGIIWVVGMLQPVAAEELRFYLSTVLDNSGDLPEVETLNKILIDSANLGHLIRVNRKPDMFSLTAKGNHFLTTKQRRVRDKERIFLLRNTWSNRFFMSSEGQTKGLDGVSPSQLERLRTEGSGANNIAPVVPSSQYYWPRYSKQLNSETGRLSASDDIQFKLLSFKNSSQLKVAQNINDINHPADFFALGLQIGISPKLLHKMAIRPRRYYRSFTIKKKSGGVRTIDAPRVFLKVVQKYIADYILCNLPVHDAVHSFRKDRSIVSNAEAHIGNNWVANIDIDSFFGSIHKADVAKLMRLSNFDSRSAHHIASLLCFNNSLPQGAPSSPAISNAYLYDFDRAMHRFAKYKLISYTRYADDITFSGLDKQDIISCIMFAKKYLKKRLGLNLNNGKTRILSQHSQQRVTGVVVNKIALPPRKLRRIIRSKVYNCIRDETYDRGVLDNLKGYLSYFRSFPEYTKGKEYQDLNLMTKEYEKLCDRFG